MCCPALNWPSAAADCSFCSDCLETNGLERALHEALARVAREKWPEMPTGRADAIHAESALKSLRIGFAAATIAQYDPEFCDFYGTIPADVRTDFTDILWRDWLRAPVDSIGLPVVELLEHPLLRVARQLYPSQPTECAIVQGFLREHLGECGARSEHDCPSSDAELIDWIAAGIDYGRCVHQEQPEIVKQIFAECGEKRLEGSLSVVQRVVAEAGGIDPVALLPALKRWQAGVTDLGEPHFFGRSVERVALIADFAV